MDSYSISMAAQLERLLTGANNFSFLGILRHDYDIHTHLINTPSCRRDSILCSFNSQSVTRGNSNDTIFGNRTCSGKAK